MPYETLLKPATFDSGVYVFADVDRLSEPMREIALELRTSLETAGSANVLFNHPTRSLRRYELLRMLHDAGLNRFNVYRAVDHEAPARFPVFLRLDRAHLGSLTPLIHSQSELEAEVKRTAVRVEQDGYASDELLVVEFLDTADADGLIRRRAAFVVGDRILPRSMFFLTNPLSSRPRVVNAETVLEEEQSLLQNRYASELLSVARSAHIEFGRFDYGVYQGQVQVWEINTNPEFGLPRRRIEPIRRYLLDRYAEAMVEWLLELDDAAPGGHPVRFTPGAALVSAATRPEHRPPAFIRPPRVLAGWADRLPGPIRSSLRRAALRILR